MFQMFDEQKKWKKILSVIFLLLISFLVFGQAITLAWLSGFPAYVSQLQTLEIKFWICVAGATAIMILAIFLIFRILRRSSDS